MDKSKMVHVSIVMLGDDLEKIGLEALYQPLSKALAPLGIYVVPIIQKANYLNIFRYNNKMTVNDFLRLVDDKLLDSEILKDRILIEYVDDEKQRVINIYAEKETFKSSIYANNDFVKNVYSRELPISFKYEDLEC